MLRAASYFTLSLMLPIFTSALSADGAPEEKTLSIKGSDDNNSFTGKISRSNVRMRLQPSLDSPVVQEMNRGDMIVVTGESNDFSSIKPPSHIKGYVYRTYVLDGVIEGNKVNVRLDPHIEAPVIAQLNTGDQVKGKISGKNAKWLEIEPPASTVFYISSDYIEKVGDAKYLARYEKRKEQVDDLLNATYLQSEAELEKPFVQMEPSIIVENYQHIIDDYKDFPQQVEQAKLNLAKFSEALLHKKVAYLEDRTKNQDLGASYTEHPARDTERQVHLSNFQNSSNSLGDAGSPSKIYEHWVNDKYAAEVNARMALWIPVEISYYEEWAGKDGNRPIQDFYEEQKGQSIVLRGVLEPYDRPVRNKPGDYLLVNKSNRLPIAYLYSTHVNLQNKVGNEVTIEGILRPNNNFAFPAYFVIGIQ